MSIKAFYMVPHPPIAVHEIGRGDEEMIRPTLESYDAVARDIAKIKPETIIITSPHQVLYSDYFHISPGRHATGDFSSFRAPEVTFNVDYDEELVNKISELCGLMNFPAGPDGERNPSLDHGVMVPLYFINKYYTNYKLVRIGLSGLSLEAHYHFGELIANAVQALGRSCVFVGSGDLSHCQKQDGPYGYKPEGPAYDEKLMDTMNRGAFKELLTFDEALLDKAEECGHRSFTIMGGAVGENKVDITTLSHESTFGVGYGFAIYHPKESTMNKTDSNDIYVNLARMTIAEYITDHKRIKVPDDLPDELTKARAGAFVSIHEHGMLRGCIGTIAPVRDSLAEEIIFNAISASTEDPRFSPIKKEELPFLEINVDVLGDAEDISSPDELDVKKYGVIVTNGYRRGLLLPDLDGVDTVEEQISIARQKAGIGPSESVQLQRFEVIRHK